MAQLLEKHSKKHSEVDFPIDFSSLVKLTCKISCQGNQEHGNYPYKSTFSNLLHRPWTLYTGPESGFSPPLRLLIPVSQKQEWIFSLLSMNVMSSESTFALIRQSLPLSPPSGRWGGRVVEPYAWLFSFLPQCCEENWGQKRIGKKAWG